jgi:predicted Zn-dependent peptidase
MFVGRRLLLLLTLLSSLSRSALAQQHYDAGNEHYAQTRLPNGLRAYLAEDHRAPLVAIDVRYPIGVLADPQEARGVAQLIGKLLPKLGTSHLPQGASDLIAAAGFHPWEIKAVVREDDTSIRVLVPAAAVDLALFIEAERMGFAADGLRTEAMVNASNELLTSFAKQSGAAGTVGFAAAQAYGPLHPFAALNQQPDFSKVDWTWLRRRLSLYNAGVATLSIVGDFDSKRLLPVIERTFGSLAGRAQPAEAQVEVSSSQRQAELRAADVSPATIWSWRAPRYLTPDDIALDVIARYVKHRLSQTLGSKDTRAAVNARQVSMQTGSYFYLYLPLSNEAEREKVEQTARAELDAIAGGQLDGAELDLAKASIVREIADGMDSLSSRAHYLTSYAHYSGKLDQFDQHLQNYQAIDATRVTEVVRRVLQKPNGILRLIKDETASVRQLKGLSPAEFVGTTAEAPLSTADAPGWYTPPGSVVQPRFDTPRIAERTVGKTRLLFMPRTGLPTIRLRVALNWRGRAPMPRSRLLLLNTLMHMHALRSRLTDLGAKLETQVNDDTLALVATTLADRADAVMVALRDTLEPEQLAPEAFSAERDELLKSMEASPPTEPDTLTERWFARVGYRKGHRYQLDLVTDAARTAALKTLTLRQLETFWKAERRAERVTVSIVGPIDDARAQELTRLGTPHFRAGAAAAAPRAEAQVSPQTILLDAPEASDVRARFSWPMGAWGSQAFVDGVGLQWALGELSSPQVARVLSENGVKGASEWTTNATTTRDAGSITLSVRVPKTEVTALFKAVRAHVVRLQHGDIPWAAEQEARRATVQWLTRYFGSASECLTFVADHADLEVPREAGDDIYVLAQRIGRTSLAKAASALAPEKATVIVYGPVADLATSLQDLGFGRTSVVSTVEVKKP